MKAKKLGERADEFDNGELGDNKRDNDATPQSRNLLKSSSNIRHETDSEKLYRCLSAHLIRKGWNITSGMKFGADLLVYAHSVEFTHAKYMINLCLQHSLSLRDVSALVRLASTVRKTLLLAIPSATRSNISKNAPPIEGIKNSNSTVKSIFTEFPSNPASIEEVNKNVTCPCGDFCRIVFFLVSLKRYKLGGDNN